MQLHASTLSVTDRERGSHLASKFILGAALSLIATGTAVNSLAAGPPAHTTAFHLNSARIDRTLEQMVASGRVAGASVLIWKDGREAYFGHSGYADREARRPMNRDTLVQIFSMTKPVTGVALMQLWEQGRFHLDDPLANYLPEFAAEKVFKGMDAAGRPILAPPMRPILIRDILRHTAGFGYHSGPTYPERVLGNDDPLDLHNDLAGFSGGFVG